MSKQLEDNKKKISEYKKKLDETLSELEKYKKKFNNLIKNLKNYVHNGIRCEKCFEEPIIGFRYKCSVCNNYNLCQKCEEENEVLEEHSHYFIKIGKKCRENNNNN